MTDGETIMTNPRKAPLPHGRGSLVCLRSLRRPKSPDREGGEVLSFLSCVSHPYSLPKALLCLMPEIYDLWELS